MSMFSIPLRRPLATACACANPACLIDGCQLVKDDVVSVMRRTHDEPASPQLGRTRIAEPLTEQRVQQMIDQAIRSERSRMRSAVQEWLDRVDHQQTEKRYSTTPTRNRPIITPWKP